MENIKSQSRRDFLKSSAIAGGGLMLSFSWFSDAKAADKMAQLNLAETWSELASYIKITPDNVVKILCPNPEFGQNVMTSLPMMVAEELDVDWKNVVVEMGTHDNVKYGPQFTGGSNSVRMYWKPLRNAGATARQMLIEAAAQTWSVPASEITTKAGVLSHSSGKSAKYGEMSIKAATIAVPKDVKLKSPKDFSIVRNSKKNSEGTKVVTGKPLFGIDYKVDGMLIAMIQHPPAFGMKLKSFDATAAKKMAGIKDIFSFKLYDDGFEQGGFDTRTFNEMIAIVGKSTWEVMNARKKIVAQWEPISETKETISGFGGRKTVNNIPARLETTAKQFELMAEMSKKPANQIRKDGDPETAFKNATQIIERTYNAPFLAHNTMEPMNFFAHVQDDKALVAGPLQAPGWMEPTLAKLLNLPADKIEIQMTRMGGGFGRRAYGSYVYEAARISQKMKAPVKLIYTREDDMTYGIYRPMYTATYRAALDANKNLIGFHVTGGGIPENPIHANRFPAGAVDNYLADGWEIPSNITIGAFRAPRSNFNAAAEQSFLDEVAEAMGKDPIEMRLELLKKAKANPVGKNNDYDASRYIGVLELLKEKSGWGKPENAGKKRGVAAYFCHASYAGHVVDMVIRDGQPYVEHVTSAVDCGVVVNPDAARNMVQGAVVDGIGNSFYGGLTHKDGVSEQNNFHNYRMIRHNEAPQKIDVHFVENDIDPTGLGEPPFPPVFGAVANALFKTTGKRYYNQPFTAEQPKS
ncbi:molybdopterin cofactor-binding domain-containing protein [Arcicella sp. LKC2W]|uniref:xanthine dehydrogenase family protein molybdopterin-binding subunit n=1 Tax=Arcicella sp. LKC2W TaxID=2984198 RepID=UPI002B1F47E4|nr:molybdopterin cofactor-binding domain-containing protein [Arcicella sp. LKC2W]MEA5460918.1 molybdopterin cofactor-binding domain-containing protein [Arcicella sp. LKC2W]